ncbi:uncharacterized protein ACJ7VT_018276 [Polymixia lowei]
MAGDDFQARYATVMDSMLRSAVAETTKLFETMVEELKAEISTIKKENEDLKSKCNDFENMQNQVKESEPEPGPSCAVDRRDTGVQCELVPLRPMLVDHCYAPHLSRISSEESQDQQGEHEQMEVGLQKEQHSETNVGGNPLMAFVLVKQEGSDCDDSIPRYILLKQENGEPAVVCRLGEIQGSPGIAISCFTPEQTPEAHGAPCTAGDNGITCESGVQSQVSEPVHPPVVTLPAVEVHMRGNTQPISETSAPCETPPEVITLEEQPVLVVEQQSVDQPSEKEQPSAVTQQFQRVNDQLSVPMQPPVNVPSKPEQLSEPAPLSKERASQELVLDLAEIEVSSSARRRGRPPKKVILSKSQQQPVKEKVQSPSVKENDILPQPVLAAAPRRGRPPKKGRPSTTPLPAQEAIPSPAIGIPSIKKVVNSPSREVEEIKVRSLPISTASPRRGRPRKNARPSTILPVQEMIPSPSINVPSIQEELNNLSREVEIEVSSQPVSAASCRNAKPSKSQLPAEMEEKVIQSPSIQGPLATETMETSSSELPNGSSVQSRERHASYPTLQDAMLLVEAINAQTSEYQSTMQNTFSSLQKTLQIQHSPPLVTSQTDLVAPDQPPSSLSPQMSTTPQPPSVPHQTASTLPTVEQSETAQSSAQQFVIRSQTAGVSPKEQSTTVAQAQLKAIVKPSAVILPKTTVSPIPPSTVASWTSIQSQLQRPFHPRITLITPNKHLSNAAPPKIIVVPKPVSSISNAIAALSPTQLSTVVSTVVAAQRNNLPPASTAVGVPLTTQSVASVPPKTTAITSRQSLSTANPQTDASSIDQQSTALSYPKITIVVPRPMSTMVPRQEQSSVAPQTVLARQQQSAEPPPNVMVSTSQPLNLSLQQSGVNVATPTSTVESAVTLPKKCDNMGSARKTALVSKMTTAFTDTCSNLKMSTLSRHVQTSPPKVTPVFQNKVSAVVKLTKLSLTASTKETTQVLKASTLSTETHPSLKDCPRHVQTLVPPTVPDTSQEQTSAVVKSSQLSPASAKGFVPFSRMATLATETCPSLKAPPIMLQLQAPVLLKEPNAVQENPLAVVKSCHPTPATSAKEISSDSSLSTENLSTLKESPIISCVQMSVPTKVLAEVQEKPSTKLTQLSNASTEITRPVSKTSTSSTEANSNLEGVPVSNSGQVSVTPNEPTIIQEKSTAAPLRLTSVCSMDTTSDPHLQMTKTQFLAQLAVSPVVQQKVLSSDAMDSKADGIKTRTSDQKRLHKDSLFARLRSHLRSHFQASETQTNPESFTEPEPTPVSTKKPRSGKDGETPRKTTSESKDVGSKKSRLINDSFHSNKTTSEPIPVSPKEPELTNDAASPENMTNEATSVSPRRSRSTKDGTSPKNMTKKPTSVSPRRPRLTKDGASPKSTNNEPTSITPRKSRLTKEVASPKKANSESPLLSPRRPRLAKDGVGPKKNTSEATLAKKPRLIQDGNSPKRSIRVANGKKLTKAAKAKTLSKIKNSKQSKSQNGANASQSTKNHVGSDALKKAKAKAVWTPPRLAANKSPLTKGKSLSLMPAKRDTRSQNQVQIPTYPQRRSQSQTQIPSYPQRRSQSQTQIPTYPQRQSQSNFLVTPQNQSPSTPPNQSQTVAPSTGSSPCAIVYPPSISLTPIPVRAPPIVSPLQPLSVIGWRLLRNQCGECGRVLSSTAALESHVSLHTGRRPFSCTLCGKRFTDTKALRRHGRVHRNGRIHVCSQCGKGFVYRFGLTKHLQMVHNRVKPFLCWICDKGFFTKRDVEAHVRVHTGEKPFHCNLCEKQFKRRVDLNVHLRWHNGEKRHWCPYCGKGFLDYNNLKRHKYIHTGEKPHSCPHCPKNFTQSGHLKKHLKNVHKVR